MDEWFDTEWVTDLRLANYNWFKAQANPLMQHAKTFVDPARQHATLGFRYVVVRASGEEE
ncbi:MAG TPA: hypothetical protein VJ933_07035 [Phaeodactylibacter sp.]|nr:hypothetical protein [Phaeodactylibacter sp.]